MAGLTPPARSWFRLASIARMEGAEAAAAAATARGTPAPTTPLPPRAPILRPQQQPTLPPPPPPTLPPPPPLSPTLPAEPQPKLPVAPAPQPEIQTQAPAAAPPPSPNGPRRPSTPPRAATPPESPKVIMATPIQPQPNPEPEPEPEPEPKTMALPPPQPQSFSAAAEDQKSIINGNGSRASNVYRHKLQAEEEKQLRVITMAGENTGAIMDIGSAASRRLGHHIHHADVNGRGGTAAAAAAPAAKTKHVEAVVNSNVQGINNSIVFNSSTTQHSPGVHITFASNRKGHGSAASSGHNKEHDSDHLH